MCRRPGDVYQAHTSTRSCSPRTMAAPAGSTLWSRGHWHLTAGHTRFLKTFGGIARRRFPHALGRGGSLDHLTYIDDLVAGLRLCATGAHGRGLQLLAGPEYTAYSQSARGADCNQLRVKPPAERRGRVRRLARCARGDSPLLVDLPPSAAASTSTARSRAFTSLCAGATRATMPAVDLRTDCGTLAWYRAEGLL